MTQIVRRPLRGDVKMLPAELLTRSEIGQRLSALGETPAPEAVQKPRRPKRPRDITRADYQHLTYDKVTGRWRISLKIGRTSIPLGQYMQPDEAAWAYRQARHALQDIWRHQMAAARDEAQREARKQRIHA